MYWTQYVYRYKGEFVVLAKTQSIVTSLQDIASLRQEHFIVFSLDSGRRIIKRRTVFIGTLTGVLAHPREVFAPSVEDRAAAIIVAHNHPSGDVEPSKQDIAATQQLIAAGQILGIRVEDHIIVAGKKHFSFLKHGLMPQDIYGEKEGYK